MAKLITKEIDSSSLKKINPYKLNVLIFYVISLLRGMQFITPVVVPFFLDWGGLNFTQIMTLQSIYFISMVISEIPLGTIADLISKKFSIILSLALSIIAIVLYSSIHLFYVFCIAEICWGFAGSLNSGADKALIYDGLVKLGKQSDSASIYGRYDSFRILGLLIAAPIGSIISTNIDVRFAMMFMIFPIGISFVLSLFLEEVNPKQKSEKSYLKLVTSGFRSMWNTRELRLIILDILVVATLTSHLAFTYQEKLIEMEVNQNHFGWISMVYMGSAVFFMNVYKYLVKFLGSKRRMLYFASISAGLGLLCFYFATSLVGVVIGIIFVTGLGMTYFDIGLGYCQTFIGSEERSTVISTISMFRLLALSIVNFLVGFIAEINLSLVFLGFGIPLIIWGIFSPLRMKHLAPIQPDIKS